MTTQDLIEYINTYEACARLMPHLVTYKMILLRKHSEDLVTNGLNHKDFEKLEMALSLPPTPMN